MTNLYQPNRLINEKSPYLLQHAYNPVQWLPWSDEAFTIAQEQNKPIFLSIGYSTCHWCHVMAHESFEDVEVAEILNRDYISIKVDREERPDVDHLYMAVCQAMTGQGGWPLTVLLTPDKLPFFAGTYYPKVRRQGRAGLMDILTQIADKWREDEAKVRGIGQQIIESTTNRLFENREGNGEEVSAAILHKAFEIYVRTFDSEFGGFASPPKFPTSHNLSFLLRYHKRTGDRQALHMVEHSLDMMQRGGMYDHIGFGFSRYSVDQKWLVPHFEKMLYDNALLSMTYVEAYQVTRNPLYAEIASNVLTYVLRDMTDPQGGFYCAEDADSEGEEGKFYVWTPDEVIAVLGVEEGELFNELYDISAEGNFEELNIPNLLAGRIEGIAKRKQWHVDDVRRRIEASRQALFTYREQRIHPSKDDKILTSWNGLMIVAMAKAARALGRDDYRYAAERAANFILTHMRREDGRLLARYRDGEAAILGYVDDYAFLVWGLIELYQTTFEVKYLQVAVKLNEDMLRLFWDHTRSGLFFYGHDGEQLPTRPKEIYDGALPSGNSAAALNLLRLAKLTYNAELSQRADEQLRAFSGAVLSYPTGHSLFLAAVDFAYGDATEIVIAGDPDDESTQDMIRLVHQTYLPNALMVLHPTLQSHKAHQVNDDIAGIRELIPLVHDKLALGGRATAYVCQNFACQSPTNDLEELQALLALHKD